jgi:hypothetical protein
MRTQRPSPRFQQLQEKQPYMATSKGALDLTRVLAHWHGSTI